MSLCVRGGVFTKHAPIGLLQGPKRELVQHVRLLVCFLVLLTTEVSVDKRINNVKIKRLIPIWF